MAKSGKRRRREQQPGWSGADHAARDEALRVRKDSNNQSKHESKFSRTELLTHNTSAKREAARLQLHITKTQRRVDDLRRRLKCWDPESELERQKRQEEAERQASTQDDDVRKKTPGLRRKPRPGPETWKLRGAARPAWEVYDFDVRYVDKHLNAHEDALRKQQRSINVLLVYKGRIGELQELAFAAKEHLDQLGEVKTPKEHQQSQLKQHQQQLLLGSCTREYLAALMELGFLSYEAKAYKTARAVWLECVELEGSNDGTTGVVLTSARENLLRMYVELGRFEAALRLHDEMSVFQPLHDNSTWVRYSAALTSFLARDRNNDNSFKNQKNHSTTTTIPDLQSPPTLSTPQDNNENHSSNDSNNISILSPKTSDLIIHAVRANILCAYYIAHYESTFVSAIECTDEVDDLLEQQDDLQSDNSTGVSTLEEALDYCNSNQQYHVKLWTQSGAAAALRNMLSDVSIFTKEELEWDSRLSQIVVRHKERLQLQKLDPNKQNGSEIDCQTTKKLRPNPTILEDIISNDDDDHDSSQTSTVANVSDDEKDAAEDDDYDDNDNSNLLPMFAGMFRTGMEMLQEIGLLPPQLS